MPRRRARRAVLAGSSFAYRSPFPQPSAGGGSLDIESPRQLGLSQYRNIPLRPWTRAKAQNPPFLVEAEIRRGKREVEISSQRLSYVHIDRNSYLLIRKADEERICHSARLNDSGPRFGSQLAAGILEVPHRLGARTALRSDEQGYAAFGKQRMEPHQLA